MHDGRRTPTRCSRVRAAGQARRCWKRLKLGQAGQEAFVRLSSRASGSFIPTSVASTETPPRGLCSQTPSESSLRCAGPAGLGGDVPPVPRRWARRRGACACGEGADAAGPRRARGHPELVGRPAACHAASSAAGWQRAGAGIRLLEKARGPTTEAEALSSALTTNGPGWQRHTRSHPVRTPPSEEPDQSLSNGVLCAHPPAPAPKTVHESELGVSLCEMTFIKRPCFFAPPSSAPHFSCHLLEGGEMGREDVLFVLVCPGSFIQLRHQSFPNIIRFTLLIRSIFPLTLASFKVLNLPRKSCLSEGLSACSRASLLTC